MRQIKVRVKLKAGSPVLGELEDRMSRQLNRVREHLAARKP